MKLLDKLNKFSGETYLCFAFSENYPEQKPKYKNAKWYDLFWLLIPMIGFVLFMVSIDER